ncbi:hypothetical protein BBJ28_00010239 [Nothophytophthora sp. Chile5]|nr:hypothetical protein BBJ28_00010239 [Nothophytophthora sp. Chile5]
MLALDEYCQRTSLARVLAVCLITPLIPLLVIVLTECIPLSPVEAGTTANYVFWIRHDVMGTLLVLCAMLQARASLPELALTTRQICGIACGTAGVYTALNVLIAELWVFPLPFLILTGAPLMIALWGIATRLVLGPDPLYGIPDGSVRCRGFLQLTAAQTSLLGIYPAYQAVFLAAGNVFQLLLVAVLPFMNLALKNVLAVCGAHLEDNLPETIVFSVEVFSAIYSVLCMRSANSLRMAMTTTAINAGVMMLSLHGMTRRSRVALASRSVHQSQLQSKRTDSFLKATATAASRPEMLSTLVAATVKLLQTPGQLDLTELRKIRLLSGVKHKLSETNTTLLDALAARCVYNNERRTSVAISMTQRKSRFASAAVEERVFSSSHFTMSVALTTRLAQRLRVALVQIPAALEQIPATSKRLSIQLGARLGGRQGSTVVGSRQDRRSSKENATDSDTDSLGSFPHAAPTMPTAKPSTIQTPRLSKPRLLPASSWLDSDRSISELVPTSTQIETAAKLRPLLLMGAPAITDVLQETRKQNTKAVNQTLQLLFNNEYLALIAYTQCVIPILYVLYMPVLQAVPNHVYYPIHYQYLGDAAQFVDRMLVIAMLAALQLVLLVVLHVFVASRFAVSTIYQVAFVLETHSTLVQSKVLIYLIFAVQSTLQHYGKTLFDGEEPDNGLRILT